MNFNSNKEKLIFYNIPTILFSFIPFFLITGPLLSDISVSFISLLFLIYCVKKKNFLYFRNKYFYFFLIFWLYLIINSLINNFNLDSLKISFFYFRYGVFVIAMVALLKVDEKFIKYFFYCIFVCFLALVFDGFYQYFVGQNILGWKSSVRISSFFGEEKILGSYLSRLWPIFFGLSTLVLKQRNKLFYLFLLTFIFSEALIFISGDRSAFFYINLSAVFVILFSQKLIKLRLFTLICSITILILISVINPTAKERVFDTTLNQMNLSEEKKQEKDQEGIYIFSKEHTHHYITAYKMYLDNKFLGVGIKNFRNFCDDDSLNEKVHEKWQKRKCSTHPHNFYFEMLSEIGSVGFLIIISFFIFSFYTFFDSYKKNKDTFLLLNCFIILIYFIPFLPKGSFFSNWNAMIFWFVFSFIFSIYNKSLNEKS